MQPSQYHIFSLPPELLATLTPRTLLTRLPTRPPSPDAADADADPTSAASKPGGPRACAVCLGKVFLDVTEQRAHFRSDWHRYNVKTRVKGGQPVSEPAFAQLLEGLDDSLSGSASSDDDDDGSDSDAVNTLINKTKHLTRSPSPSSAAQTQSGPVTALAWFHSPPSTQLGIYRAILPLHTPSENYLHELRELQTPVGEGGRTWAMFMIAGGHFAGAIVRVSRDADEEEEEEGKTKKKKPKKPKPETEVLLHKTFHRYTTRRKQGGSQSTNDNAKGNAKSAGAQLRRYGEQALRDDIRGLLAEWKESLDECERIWIRANTSNRRIFYDYEEAPFARNDERLRTFPFPTRRPTHTEIARCLNELVRPKISHYTEDELRAQDEAYLASLPKPKPVPTAAPEAEKEKEKPKPVKLSKEEEAYREKWTRLLEMVHKNRVEPLKAFVERERATFVSIDVPIPEWTGETRGTILQVAVQDGHEELVKWLLEEGGADPTIAVPSSRPGEAEEEEQHASDASGTPARAAGGRRAAYDLARTKGVRDVFRRCAAAHPERWDWLGAGHVPSALSAEMEREQEEKKKVRRRGLKERVKEREAREREKVKDETPLHPPPPLKEVVADGGPREQATSRRLGGGSGAAEGIAGLSAEMRMKVERERRARAAEARAKALGG